MEEGVDRSWGQRWGIILDGVLSLCGGLKWEWAWSWVGLWSYKVGGLDLVGLVLVLVLF